MFTVITENDNSQWEDQTGILYHFPKKYLKILQPGTHVAYYKGSIRNKSFSVKRLSDKPHYFGIAKIGKIYNDRKSSKGDLFATIIEYQQFNNAILAKTAKGYIESIPESRKDNYWRDGARLINQEIYSTILDMADGLLECNDVDNNESENNDNLQGFNSGGFEGGRQIVYSTKYERNPRLRAQAIEIHGTTCCACDFNFEEKYGDVGKGFIHIHHIKPLSDGEERIVDPENDLIPLCPNCHSIIHRYKTKTLSIDELKVILGL